MRTAVVLKWFPSFGHLLLLKVPFRFHLRLERIILPEKTLLINTDGTQASAETFFSTVNDRHEQRRHDIERPILAPDILYLSPDQLQGNIEQLRRVDTHHFKQENYTNNQGYNYPVSTLPSLLIQGRSENPLILIIYSCMYCISCSL
jgi:transcription-repair coupling factor (superfamily II helicase)